jgi:hypothetical protein
LPNDANAVATCPIDRDDRLKSELDLVGHVDHAGIDGSSRVFFTVQVGDLRLKVPLDASVLIGKGVDILTISRRLGHGKPSVTLDTYGHLIKAADAAAADAIAGLLS